MTGNLPQNRNPSLPSAGDYLSGPSQSQMAGPSSAGILGKAVGDGGDLSIPAMVANAALGKDVAPKGEEKKGGACGRCSGSGKGDGGRCNRCGGSGKAPSEATQKSAGEILAEAGENGKKGETGVFDVDKVLDKVSPMQAAEVGAQDGQPRQSKQPTAALDTRVAPTQEQRPERDFNLAALQQQPTVAPHPQQGMQGGGAPPAALAAMMSQQAQPRQQDPRRQRGQSGGF